MRSFIKVLVFLLLFVNINLFSDSENQYERFLFISYDLGLSLKGWLSGGTGYGGLIEFANFRYVGIAANLTYFDSYIVKLTGYGLTCFIYPEGYGPYGYYFRIGLMYHSGSAINEGALVNAELITIPMNLGMKFVFDDFFGFTLDPYLEGEIYLGISDYYKSQPFNVRQSIGCRIGFTF